MSRKPRSDAKLLSMPPHYREALIRWLTDENMNYADAKARLASEYSVRTSTGALSQFYATQCFSLRYSQASEIADTVATEMKMSPDKFDEATISLVRQKTFERAVAKDGNLDELALLAKILHDSKKLRLQEGDQKIQERKLSLLESKMAEAKAKLEGLKSKGGLSAETLKQIEEAAAIL